MYSIKNHLLAGEGIKKVSCTKNKVPFDASYLPDTIIIHFTVGSSANNSAEFLARDDVQASAHLVIGRDGAVYQLVPFNLISWHAGNSKYGDRVGFNKYSIGIELDNAGPILKTGANFISTFGKSYPESEVIFAKHRNEAQPRYWHAFTEPQIQSCRDICIALIQQYKIKQILGHEEISPGRKVDPGPAFPLDKLRNDLLMDMRNDEGSDLHIGIVTASKLNIRVNPGLNEPLTANPLPFSTRVTILEEKEGWYRVWASVEGWVKKEYIRIIS